MSQTYVTQGVVNITLKKGSKFEFRITPRNEYALKHKAKTYTVFIHRPNDSKDRQVFESICVQEDQEFPLGEEFANRLIQAALNKTCLEITMDITVKDDKIVETETEVTAIQLPASSDASKKDTH
jgi:hypothetical protein